jgi:cobyrinic acid a,c-diamide synthase
LVTSVEHPAAAEALGKVKEVVEQHVDVEALRGIAGDALALPEAHGEVKQPPVGNRVRIGVLQDRAFSFYYPENLEALESAGGELVPVSPLEDDDFPDVDALYAGGGFPEVHAAELSRNESFKEKLAGRIGEGLPVWAECGGLMYLSRYLVQSGTEHTMVGALPVGVEQMPRPQGHGYVRVRVDGANPFFEHGTELTGHEFHYSRIRDKSPVETILDVERGVGLGDGRDGIRAGSVVAGYTHLHALGTPQWAPSLVKAARG